MAQLIATGQDSLQWGSQQEGPDKWKQVILSQT